MNPPPITTQLRDFLHRHPSVVLVLGLMLAALGQWIAGDPAGAQNSLYTAVGFLSVKAAAKPAPPAEISAAAFRELARRRLDQVLAEDDDPTLELSAAADPDAFPTVRRSDGTGTITWDLPAEHAGRFADVVEGRASSGVSASQGRPDGTSWLQQATARLGPYPRSDTFGPG